MCGIIGIINKDGKPANKWIVDQYQDQQARGTKGFGVILVDKNGDYLIHRATTEAKALLDLHYNEAPIIFMHHRWPTSSENKLQQTHPITINDGSLKHKYLFLHNGIIKNDYELKTNHEKLGFVYTTYDKETFKFNDSESAAIEVARFIEKQIKKIAAEG